MSLNPLALLCRLERERRVRGERDGNSELLVRAQAVQRVAERHDPDDLPVGMLQQENSSSFGCQPSGPSTSGLPVGTNLEPVSCDQSNASFGMKYVPARRNVGWSKGFQLSQS